jgi:hypothetical protein
MMKEKPKGKPENSWMKFSLKLAVFLMIPTVLCGIFFVAVGIFGIGTGGYFKRFETPDEVVTFLYANFEESASNSVDVLTFMSEYIPANECHRRTLNQFSYVGLKSQGNVNSYIGCLAETISALARGGTWYYSIRFYFYEDDTLAYIEVEQICACL